MSERSAECAPGLGQLMMSSLALHPRVGPTGVLRIWLGLFETNAAPVDISWTRDGSPVSANIVQPLEPAHKHGARSFSGIFDIAVPPGGRGPYRVRAKVAGSDPAELVMNPIPSELSERDWLRVRLTSCYHQAEDRSGLAGRAIRNLSPAERPDLSILMGDQVYLDLPTIGNFPDNDAKLARQFESGYATNWRTDGALADILNAAPSICCADDHEYWNNFPHRSPFIQNSWGEDSRARWKNAADQVYDAFQGAAPVQRGEAAEINIDPLSIMVLDQRSHRQPDRSSALTTDALEQLNTWVDRLIAEKKFGALVTGQSLLDEPTGNIRGRVADWTLANYGDYAAVVEALERLADAGRPVLLLTGDVHWGRVTAIRENGRTKFYEIICSPTSLVSTVGSDQLKNLGAGFRSLFGRKPDPWPRHADPLEPTDYFAPQVFGKKYRTKVLHEQKGDQFASLALRRSAGTLEANVTYYEINKAPGRPVKVDLGLLR